MHIYIYIIYIIIHVYIYLCCACVHTYMNITYFMLVYTIMHCLFFQALDHFIQCPLSKYPGGEHIDMAIETVSGTMCLL